MAETVGPQCEQLGLRETIVNSGRDLGRLVFTVVIHAAAGAVDGAKKGIGIVEQHRYAQEHIVQQLEDLANDPQEHKNI